MHLPLMIKSRFFLLYFVVVGALLGLAAYSAIPNVNVDGVSYASISEHYVQGNWKEAVNAYWSPALSWLMTPFIALDVEGPTAYRIIAVVIALGILTVGHRLVVRLTKNRRFALAVFHLSILPFLFYAVRHDISPDLLVSLWALSFVAILGSSVLETKKIRLVLLGLFCGLGFLIKSILLPISVATLIIWFLWIGKSRPDIRARIKLVTIPLLTTAIVVLLWAIPLSLKYEKLTTGSSSNYSISLIGPDSVKHPVRNGLIPPSNRVAVTPWEDPTTHKFIEWSPLNSLSDFGYYLDYVFTNNLPKVLKILAELSPFLVGFLFSICLLLILGRVTRSQDATIVLALLVSLLFISAYGLTHVQGGARYLWPALILSVLSLSILLGSRQTYVKERHQSTWLWVTTLVFPAVLLVNWQGLSFSKPAYHRNEHSNIALRNLAFRISKTVEPRARFASNSFTESTVVSYYANLAGYGSTTSGLSFEDPTVRADLRKNKIKYYLYIEEGEKVDFSQEKVLFWEDMTYQTNDRYEIRRVYFVRLRAND